MRRAESGHRARAAVALLAILLPAAVGAQDYPVENAPVGTLPVGRGQPAVIATPPSAATAQPPVEVPETSATPADAPATAVGAPSDSAVFTPAPSAPDANALPVAAGDAEPTQADADGVQPNAAAIDSMGDATAPAVPADPAPAPVETAMDGDAAAPAVGAAAPVADAGADAAAPFVDEPAPAPFLIDPSGNPPERAGPVAPFMILGSEIAVGTRADLGWRVGESFDGNAVTTPVVVLHGAKPGPRLCLTAAVHGDELNGIEVVRRIVNEVDPRTLGGTVIGVPVVNLLGFSRGTRYLPDRRDLNRFFPGSPGGSAAARIAHSLFNEIVVHCDALVDFHTGSFDRANLPQVRGDLTEPAVLAFTRGFGATPVLHSPGARGMLRLAASFRGIPAVTFEVGAPQRIEPEQIEVAVQAISTLMHKMGMSSSFRLWAEPQATYYESKWVRSNDGGMLISTVRLGDRVREGQRLGKVVDPLRNTEQEILSPFRGRVIGLALNQVVLPGFAAYHIGIETSEQGAVEEALAPAPGVDPIERMEGDEMEPPPVPDGEPRSEPDSPMPPD